MVASFFTETDHDATDETEEAVEYNEIMDEVEEFLMSRGWTQEQLDNARADAEKDKQTQTEPQPQPPGVTEFLAINHAHRFMVMDTDELFISTSQGLWTSLSNNVGQGALQSVMREIYGKEQDRAHSIELNARLTRWLDTPPTGIIKAVREQMNQEPLVQSTTGAIFDLRTAEVLDTDEVRRTLTLHGSLPVVDYNPSLEIPHMVTQAFRHFGVDVFRRIAWQLISPHKTIDTIRIPQSDAGKSTLCRWIQNSLVGGVAVLDAYAQLKEREFSELRRQLTQRMLVFLDEADKIESPPSVARVNEMTNDAMQVNVKYKQEQQLPRKGNAILIGADWPNLTTAQGADTRFTWAIDLDCPVMPAGMREGLLTQEAATYLGTWLVDTAAAMWRRQDDGSTIESKAAAQMNLDSTIDPLFVIMRDILSPGGPDDWVSSVDLKGQVQLHPMAAEMGNVNKLASSPRWKAAITQAVKSARPKRSGKNKGWSHVKVDYTPAPFV